MGEMFCSDNSSVTDYRFSELFDLNEIQKLQDIFSAAVGVASVITELDGTPITTPSGFCSFCRNIGKSEVSRNNCLVSDLVIRSQSNDSPKIQRCLNGELLDGGASIVVEGRHIANWLIRQPLDEDDKVDASVNSANVFEVKRMTKMQFDNVCNFLFLNAEQLSKYVTKNILLTQEIKRKTLDEKEIKSLNKSLEMRVKHRTTQLEEINAELEETNAMLEETNAELEEANAMLEEEVTKRQKAEEHTKKLNEELESKVIERTNQLQDMNTMLEEEIIEKIRAEEELQKERVFTEAIFHSVPGMIYLYDESSNLVRWNNNHEEMTGYSSQELATMNLFDWYKGDAASQTAVREGINKANQSGFGDAEATLQKKDGTKLPMYFTACPVTIEGKQYFAGIGIDITEQKKMHQRLEKYRILAEKANDAMLFLDKEGNILEANDAALRVYGYTSSEFSGMTIFDLRHLDKASDITNQMDIADQEGIVFETVHYLKDGTPINVEVSSQGTFVGSRRMLLSIVRNITDRKKKEDENLYLSYHDALTGLYNRRFYKEEIKRLDTERNLPISIIVGDVNGLKLANDAFGHNAGDELLQKAADAIQNSCRAEDLVARWGGDEFVLLLPRTKMEEAEEIVKRIKEQYSNVYVNAIRLSISFGWDTKKKIDEDIQKVLKNAEDYMYKHKFIESEGMRGNIISTIINTLHEKNPREEQHSQRVSEICQNIGKAMGFSETKIRKLKVVGLLHDIGKIAIEERILNKPGNLTERERDEIKRHPDIGYRILSSSYEMLELADCVLAHHERWDGTGYPKGLKGETIPQVARIIALADSYDAMTSERSYRNALSEEKALAEIRNNAGTQFDPVIARIFIEEVLGKQWS